MLCYQLHIIKRIDSVESGRYISMEGVGSAQNTNQFILSL